MTPSSDTAPDGAAPTPSALRACALRMADAAATVTCAHFRQALDVDDKSQGDAFDPVTRADREAESAMRALALSTFPDLGFVGEETGATKGRSRYRWIVDPIDGTRSFIAGVPVWGTLIGLMDGEAPVLGVSDHPFLGERYVGSAWNGARTAVQNADGAERALRTRDTASLGDALLTCTTPHLFAKGGERAAYDALEARCRLSRYSLDCYGYCLMAAGHFDLVVEAQLAPYDILPLIPIIEGAGGVVSDWRGRPAHGGGQVIAAANATLHAAALELLRPGAA